MKQSRRNEITRAVEAWRAKQPQPWMSIKWPPLLPHSYEPIWYETTWGGDSSS